MVEFTNYCGEARWNLEPVPRSQGFKVVKREREDFQLPTFDDISTRLAGVSHFT